MESTAPADVPTPDTPPIERAIRRAGSEAKLAKLIGCSQVAINKAKHRNRVSGEMAVAIDRAFDGEISKADLRPDLFTKEEARA
ncbi:MAG: YdaS family helix-turn-helix protein [Pseudolabrys sp.]|nr:YdaS family helix-turn-helix protein [Pseudolabrys sp.]